MDDLIASGVARFIERHRFPLSDEKALQEPTGPASGRPDDKLREGGGGRCAPLGGASLVEAARAPSTAPLRAAAPLSRFARAEVFQPEDEEAGLLLQAAALAWNERGELPPSVPGLRVSATRFYGHLVFGRNRFGVATDRKQWTMWGLDPHVVIRLKRTFPRISSTETKSFVFPDTDETCADLSWFVARYPLEIGDEDLARLAAGEKAFGDRRDRLERISLPGWQPPRRAVANYGFVEGFVPAANQVRAMETALEAGRLLVADDVGLGKTETMIGIIASSGLMPAAVIVEPHLGTQWARRVAKRSKLVPHIIAGTSPYDLPAADVYIFKYSNIVGWVDIAEKAQFRLVGFDEIQQLRAGETTAKGKAAAVFAKNAVMRIGLSATPVFNYGGEIWHVMNYIEEGCLGSYEEFYREWCSLGGAHAIVKDPEALGTYLRERHLLVREVRSGRPVNTIVHYVDYDEDIADDFASLLRSLAVRVTTGSFTERGQAARELDMMARQATGVAKARHVAAYVRMLLEGGTPVVLAGWHRDVYDIWLKELEAFDPVLYTGSETPKQKDDAKARFEAGETDLFIISLRSGAGLDGLQKRCSTIVIGELDWSPKVHDQVIGRLDRPGQVAEEVTAIYLVADDGADPEIVEVLGLKASQARAIVDPGAGVVAVHSDASRIKALAQRYLSGTLPDPPPHAGEGEGGVP